MGEKAKLTYSIQGMKELIQQDADKSLDDLI
jgi:hypothetical protein